MDKKQGILAGVVIVLLGGAGYMVYSTMFADDLPRQGDRSLADAPKVQLKLNQPAVKRDSKPRATRNNSRPQPRASVRPSSAKRPKPGGVRVKGPSRKVREKKVRPYG